MHFSRTDVLRSINIDRNDFVVEVGGGHHPFPRANLILEKFPFDTVHRSGAMDHSAPVLIADAAWLPIGDKRCDLLFGSHVIEHVPEPERFLKEIKRCAKRVYLEFPSFKRELMFAWGFHEWVIEAKENHLKFYRNDVPQLFGDFFHRQYDFVLDAWCLQRHDELNSSIHAHTDDLTWEFASETAFTRMAASAPKGTKKVNAAPVDSVSYTWRQVAAVAATKLPKPFLTLIRRTSGTHGRRRIIPLTQAVVDRLVCQKCRKAALLLNSSLIVCQACGTRYNQKHGLFDFDLT